MPKKKILIVTTYPIKNAQHGGQKRTKAIFDAYKKASNDVKFAAVYFKGFYPVAGSNDIAIGRVHEHKVESSLFTGDVIVSQAIIEDPKVKKRMTDLLKTFMPDVIHIEQVYPYMGLKPLLAELGLKPKIVFGSQNIEYTMKEELLRGVGVSKEDARSSAEDIHYWETQLAQDCDLLAAVSESDLEEHRKMGAKKTVLAPNGIDHETASESAISYWRRYFAKQNVKKIALFVGSAHPPNWAGFEAMIGAGVGFVPLDTRIVLAGSISDYFQKEYQPTTLEKITFWLRVSAVGRLSEDRLAALLRLASVIILPITEGGGSNLKTAEALLSGKKIVATNKAFRSYEQYMDLPNIWIADDPRSFHQSLLDAIATPVVERTKQQDDEVEKVTWEHVLSNLTDEVSKL